MLNETNRLNQSKANFLAWFVCFSASLFFFYEFIQGNMFASIADDIMRDFHIKADRMAYLSSIYYASNVLFLFIAGIILDTYSAKKTMLIAMLMCVLSTFLLAHAHTLWLALFCRFVTGIGSAFCFLGPVRIASRWFAPKQMALVTGAIVTVAMTGGMMAQYPLTKLVAHIGWRDALMQVGWLGCILLGIMSMGIIDKTPIAINKKINFAYTRKIFCRPQILGAAMYASLMNMAVAIFGAMIGSLYLVQRLGIDKEQASLINAMLFLGAIIGGPVIGWLSDRLELRLRPMKIASCLSLVVVLAILLLPVSVIVMKILFFLLGFFTAAQIISYALVAESCSVSATATAVSVVSILTQAGYIVYQNLFTRLLIYHGQMNMVDGVPVYALSDFQFAAVILPIGLIVAGVILFSLTETFSRTTEN